MKEEDKKIINELNGTRAKIYYQLNQLEKKTGMSIRTLKYRMKLVKEKYSNMPNLLKRNGKAWQIHYTLIDEFMPKYKKQQTNLYNHKWETFLTWNMKDDYDVHYHIRLINEIKVEIPYANIAYVVEMDGRGFNHIHAITDAYRDNVEVATSKVLDKYLDLNQYRCQVEKINNTSSATSYLSKNGTITII
jgi:hypothetical protein